MKKKIEIDKEKPSPIGGLSEKRIKSVVGQMKVGEPIPLREVPIKRRGGRTLDHWLALCKGIPKGYAQEVTGYSTSAARSAVDRLIKLGLIDDEYVVRGRGKRKSDQKIFIVHA